ncbi:recombination protein NinB, partial [Cronobacter sakazakii]|nr:recombination protein NinB [Cronobacter sakazakii]
MERQRYHLINESVRGNALAAVKSAPDKFIVDIRKPSRKLSQNAKFHSMLGDIARQVTWCGKWLRPEQWKVLLISGHAVATKQEAEVVPGLEGEYVNIRESSAEMSV